MKESNQVIEDYQCDTVVLPDWQVSLLDHLAKRGSGHTPDKAFDTYYNGGIKWVSLADSYRLDKGLIYETDYEISELGIKKSSAVLHPAGTVLMSRDAGVGKSAVMGIDMAVSQHFITWTCKPELLYNWFLYYWLQFKKEYFERQAVGSTIKTIGLPLFKKLTIKHPEYAEQKAIAKLLLTWDKAIEKTNRLITHKQLRKMWLMQQLLSGTKRIPGFKEDWQYVKVNNIGVIPAKSGITKVDNQKLLTVKLHTKGIEFNESDKPIISKSGRPYYERLVGEILIGRQNIHNGGIGLVTEEFDGHICSNAITSFRVNETVASTSFILYYLQYPVHYKRIENYMGGTGQKELSEKQFLEILIKIPVSRKEQVAVSSVLQIADKEIQLQINQLAQLKEQKKGLMELFLTGKKRLKF